MQEVPLGVVIAGHQSSEAAKHDVERLLDLVKDNKVDGAILFEPTTTAPEVGMKNRTHLTRRGLVWGAGLGFLLGLIPLVVSTLLGAAAGGVISEFTRLRLRKE